ncbi:hypothetical protein HQ48_01190 [Porphyromonas sp. COT-290 OH3588]|nr:hypothetical protein HQ48_01190 [Porphyromonas sp. COT-290 OH3588]
MPRAAKQPKKIDGKTLTNRWAHWPRYVHQSDKIDGRKCLEVRLDHIKQTNKTEYTNDYQTITKTAFKGAFSTCWRAGALTKQSAV